MARFLVAAWVWFISLVAVHAQAVNTPRVLLESGPVRVTELRVKPGGALALEGHRFQFVYMLTDGALVFTPPGKAPFELTLQSGEVSLLPSQTTQARNDGESEVRAVVVEVKEAGARPAATDTTKPRNPRKRSVKK
jgi:hypothetical protein